MLRSFSVFMCSHTSLYVFVDMGEAQASIWQQLTVGSHGLTLFTGSLCVLIRFSGCDASVPVLTSQKLKHL